MVSGTKIEAVGTQILQLEVRKTIQSIKEIVGNHSDTDIYVALKETNMDPNETAQKLLNRDPFHEVKRRRDKKKENAGYRSFTASEPWKHYEQFGQAMKFNPYPDRNVQRSGYRRNASTCNSFPFYEDIPPANFTGQELGECIKHGVAVQMTCLARVSREFRIVRDNRVNQNREIKPSLSSASTTEPLISNVPVKSSSIGPSCNQKPPVGPQSSQNSNVPFDKQFRDANSVGSSKKVLLAEKLSSVPNAPTPMQNVKTNDSQYHSTSSPNNSAIRVYSSSSDPVHVPSRDSRPAANIGAIKREVGAVGAWHQSSESSKLLSSQSSSFSNHSQNVTPESAVRAPSVGRSFSNNQYSSKLHQSVGHQKAAQPSKEWKPKSSQKASVNGVGVIRLPARAASPSTDSSKNLETEPTQLQDELSRMNISENQNVIIAAHIHVSETDRCQLTFGSLRAEFETGNSGFQAVQATQESSSVPSGSVSVSAPDSSSGEPASIEQSDLSDDRIRNSESNSPASVPVSEHQLADKKESSSPQNLDDYANIGLVRDNNLAYTPSEPQQQQGASELPSFPAYYPQTGYDIPYFRPAVDETVRGQGLPSPPEALSSRKANSIPASTIALGQQQQLQQPLPQMYPQLHISHFTPYRQFISPVCGPPMAMPGYSSNLAYPHPLNGNNYLLMPGGSSHLTAGSLKYGMQQFKPVPAGSPTGFGNFTSSSGYAINTPCAVGGTTGIEDTSRLQYIDGNLYVRNPQAETSQMWMDSSDIPSPQSASYYNMPGQTFHAAYSPSYTGHASFNAAAAAAQSSHMQFPGLYHSPPQHAMIASPHHLGAAMGGNVGVAAAASGAQVGAYPQPQLGHLNWTGNF